MDTIATAQTWELTNAFKRWLSEKSQEIYLNAITPHKKKLTSFLATFSGSLSARKSRPKPALCLLICKYYFRCCIIVTTTNKSTHFHYFFFISNTNDISLGVIIDNLSLSSTHDTMRIETKTPECLCVSPIRTMMMSEHLHRNEKNTLLLK